MSFGAYETNRGREPSSHLTTPKQRVRTADPAAARLQPELAEAGPIHVAFTSCNRHESDRQHKSSLFNAQHLEGIYVLNAHRCAGIRNLHDAATVGDLLVRHDRVPMRVSVGHKVGVGHVKEGRNSSGVVVAA